MSKRRIADLGLHAVLNEEIDRILTDAGIEADKDLVARIIASGLGLGQDEASRLNLKISAAALEEMRKAFRLFSPFVDKPKATIFGSARTSPTDPLSQQAEEVARQLADAGWMLVTGAGPGIMAAANLGAGLDNSLGVSISLPFEAPSETEREDLRVTMKYFFTRKLMLVKESSAFVALPGGFGTMDEVFELLTLQQTGKAEPAPIVLLDSFGGNYWEHFRTFIIDELEGGGYTTPGDLDRVLITHSADEAIAEVLRFWRNYDSIRWVGDVLVLRLRAMPSDAEMESLNARFGNLCATGGIEITEPLPPEVRDADQLHLPRIKLTLEPRKVGELHRLIRMLNDLPSAMSA
ncbi:TIGR00730 family Rossman fold protein [Leucobacter sp. cx-328]|uniref:LOG family protein n=1 Tax=unclassified Leucobacter TaxID=2621730 RepID=UPI00165E5B68|nr:MULTISPECIES: TIGR00730 family Rossman fold protein [unclassified Leucobacter]MBC9943214.1 TIGR00730 family Rossman fold protein [Leucobacter sp. cx-328]